MDGSAGFQPAFFRDAAMEHRDWRSRGYIPHCDRADHVQHIVFGLADARPPDSDCNPHADAEARAAWWDAAYDRGLGGCALAGDAAAIVEEALLHFDAERYRLIAWCVMPNHVHAMIAQVRGVPLDRVVHAWKSFTANQVNRLLRRSGALWQREYFDRYMRTDEQFWATKRYIELNPVAAGLCVAPTDWRWSSARRG
jgi:REP element-mobilizing transposase RayT